MGDFERETLGKEIEGLVEIFDRDPKMGDPLDLHGEPFCRNAREGYSDELLDESELVDEDEFADESVLDEQLGVADEDEDPLDEQQELPPRP